MRKLYLSLPGQNALGGRFACIATRFLLPIVILLLVAFSSAPASAAEVNIIDTIQSADTVGKICLVICLFFSIASWAVIIYKFLHIRSATRQTNKFVRDCMAGGGNLEDAYRKASSYPASPLAEILRESYLELEIEDWYKLGYNLSDDQRIDVAKVGVERVIERTISNEISHLESNLIFLAVTSNVCPFIGLFGTVWGIMAMFQNLSDQSVSSVAALAPGLSTALAVTVAGLACAIPASVAYNYFTSRVQFLTSRMDSFALELSNIIQKQLLKREV